MSVAFVGKKLAQAFGDNGIRVIKNSSRELLVEAVPSGRRLSGVLRWLEDTGFEIPVRLFYALQAREWALVCRVSLRVRKVRRKNVK